MLTECYEKRGKNLQKHNQEHSNKFLPLVYVATKRDGNVQKCRAISIITVPYKQERIGKYPHFTYKSYVVRVQLVIIL